MKYQLSSLMVDNYLKHSLTTRVFFFQFFYVKNLLKFPLENKTFPIFFFKENEKNCQERKNIDHNSHITHTNLQVLLP
jgi:DNA phosphorothioation-dependent restriction protein DptG